MHPQTKSVLDWLQTRGALTPIDALSALGVYRLAARIKELRDDGYRINTGRHVTRKGRRVAAYSLAIE